MPWDREAKRFVRRGQNVRKRHPCHPLCVMVFFPDLFTHKPRTRTNVFCLRRKPRKLVGWL